MPELPDVETYKGYIDSTSLNKKIIDVKIKNIKILEKISKKTIENKLRNVKFVKTFRHGKYLFVKTNDVGWLVLHFGMTGDVRYFKNSDEEPKHTRLLIKFENGYFLAFNNQRLLGKVNLIDNKDDYIKEKNLGVDALDLNFEQFNKVLKNRSAKIKSTLMNQKLISGIGNIYADEILFQSEIHPELKANKLTKDKSKNIYENIKKVLTTAIKANAEVDDFPENFIIPHRQKQGKCPKDGKELKTTKVNGRTTYFCPNHQKKK
jgi:formamidopyrimidine-DNA glycosylase